MSKHKLLAEASFVLYAMLKRLFILLILAPAIGLAQDIGVKLDLGASYITNEQFANTDIDHQIKPGKSANLGMFFDFSVSKKSSVSFELNYVKLESKEVLNGVVVLDPLGRPVVYGNQYIRKKISYIALPVYYSFQFDRLSVNVGGQVSTVMGGSAEVRSESEFYEYDMQYEPALNELDYGVRFGMQWKLSHRFDLEATYYHGLSDIQKPFRNGESDFWAIRQLTFGFKYAFIKEENRNEN